MVTIWLTVEKSSGVMTNIRNLSLTLITCLLLTKSLSSEERPELQSWLIAVTQNKTETLDELLNKIRDIDTPTPSRSKTALMAAAAAGDAKLFHSLIVRNANPNLTNDNGGTSLMYACWGGNLAIVEEILSLKIDPNLQASNGWTAIMMCAVKNRGKLIRSILDHDADANISDVYGWTPLMRGAYEGNTQAVISLTDNSATALEQLNFNQQSALHLAAIGKHKNIYQLLLKIGLDDTKKDFQGMSAREIAKLQGVLP